MSENVLKDLVIIGAGDFGREAIWIAERMNQEKPTWNILGFIDDEKSAGSEIDGYTVCGNTQWLCENQNDIYAACAIASGKAKNDIWSRLSANPHVHPATVIHPSLDCERGVSIGEGSIISAGTWLAIEVSVGRHCIVNAHCTMGHDTILGDFSTIHPGANLSGKVTVGKRCVLGTGTKVIQGISICDDVITGAGAVVVRDITEPGTYVGVPVKKIK